MNKDHLCGNIKEGPDCISAPKKATRWKRVQYSAQLLEQERADTDAVLQELGS